MVLFGSYLYFSTFAVLGHATSCPFIMYHSHNSAESNPVLKLDLNLAVSLFCFFQYSLTLWQITWSMRRAGIFCTFGPPVSSSFRVYLPSLGVGDREGDSVLNWRCSSLPVGGGCLSVGWCCLFLQPRECFASPSLSLGLGFQLGLSPPSWDPLTAGVLLPGIIILVRIPERWLTPGFVTWCLFDSQEVHSSCGCVGCFPAVPPSSRFQFFPSLRFRGTQRDSGSCPPALFYDRPGGWYW